MANLIGQRLGQYEIITLLGKGGMAAVYRARQSAADRDVAVKVIKPDLAESNGLARRLAHEAETLALLDHQHIVKVFDYGQQDGIIYLVMQLLPGGSLADLIDHGPLPLETCNRILGQVASALDYAHQLGIIHRDLKPQNVLFTEDGNAVLTDFGLAKVLHSSTVLSQSSTITGTPAYMAPEQWRGQTLDARTDVYALGNIVFEMVTGRPPFVADTMFTMLHLHVNEPPPPIRDPVVPAGVEHVVEKALAKDPANRFASASTMAQAFDAALHEQPVTAAAPPKRERPARQRVAQPIPARPLASSRAYALIGVPLLVMIAAMVGLISRGLSSAPTETAPPTRTLALVPTYTPMPATTTPGSATFPSLRGPTATPQVTARPPGMPVTGDVLAYCDNPSNGEARKYFVDNPPITIYWSWFARTPEQIQDHLDNAEYEVRVDGRPLDNWRAFMTDVLKIHDRYYVYWYVPIGLQTPGEHRVAYKVSWKQQISDGFRTFGPGGEVETESGSCVFVIH
jgi:serine/threonine protein kinase